MSFLHHPKMTTDREKGTTIKTGTKIGTSNASNAKKEKEGKPKTGRKTEPKDVM